MPGAISVSARTVLSGGVFSASAGRPADPSGATTGGTSTGRDVVAKPGTDGIVGVHLGEYRSTATRQGVRDGRRSSSSSGCSYRTNPCNRQTPPHPRRLIFGSKTLISPDGPRVGDTPSRCKEDPE
jgi:hypothetical protein